MIAWIKGGESFLSVRENVHQEEVLSNLFNWNNPSGNALPLSSYNLLIFHKISVCGTFHVAPVIVDRFYIALFSTLKHSLHLRVILHEWIGLYSTFQYSPKWCAYSTGIADATWNCCHLGAFCVHHTTLHHVTSCKATCVRCKHI